jgi:endoglucanase
MELDPAQAAYQRLARTVNIPPDLGAPHEHGRMVAIDRGHLEACAQNGFTAVRMTICLAAHRTPAGLAPDMLRRLEAIVADATALGLAVVISNHRDLALMADPGAHLAANMEMVAQLAGVFDGRGSDVIIEPVTEPQQALDTIWNQAAAELIAAVRAVNGRGTILLGPRTFNNARFLGELRLPDAERNLIVGVHHYWPITFTMQGESWLGDNELGHPRDWLGTTWDQTPAQEAELRAGFGAVAGWSRGTGRPVFVGEFGTTAHADPASRARWTRFNRRLAEDHGFAWGVWSFGPSFAIYDLGRRAFDPDLLAALMNLRSDIVGEAERLRERGDPLAQRGGQDALDLGQRGREAGHGRAEAFGGQERDHHRGGLVVGEHQGRQAVARHQPVAAVTPALGGNRDPEVGQARGVPADGPLVHAEPGGQFRAGQLVAVLEQFQHGQRPGGRM